MATANFAYAAIGDCIAAVPAVSVFADQPDVRGQVADDIAIAGLGLHRCDPLAALLQGEDTPPGEVVFVDCPRIDGAMLAALARADMLAARFGAHLVVSTTVAALDDVFACCDRSAPQILVDAGRPDRIVAFGRVLGHAPEARLRELGHDDRLALLRLTEEVGRIAARLEGIGTPADMEQVGAFRFESPGSTYRALAEDGGVLGIAARPPLPDPRLVRRIIGQRQARARYFDGALFADPAWDILLDLTAARAEHARVSVTSLCIASGVPPTTALRWIGMMTGAGLLARVEDDVDRRRAFIALTDKAADAMARYFADLGRNAARLA